MVSDGDGDNRVACCRSAPTTAAAAEAAACRLASSAVRSDGGVRRLRYGPGDGEELHPSAGPLSGKFRSDV